MRNVRNFWLTAEVDGYKHDLSCGPKSADGGFKLDIKMRSNGTVDEGIRVLGYATEDGTLILKVWGERGVIVYEKETER
jgi:hypothetical protein